MSAFQLASLDGAVAGFFLARAFANRGGIRTAYAAMFGLTVAQVLVQVALAVMDATR